MNNGPTANARTQAANATALGRGWIGVIGLLLLTACGNKGDLYIPQDNSDSDAAVESVQEGQVDGHD